MAPHVANVPANVPAAVTKAPSVNVPTLGKASAAVTKAQAPPVKPLTPRSPAPPASQSGVSEVPAKSAPAQGSQGPESEPVAKFCAHAESLLEDVNRNGKSVLGSLPGLAKAADVYAQTVKEKIPHATEPTDIYEAILHRGFNYMCSLTRSWKYDSCTCIGRAFR